VEALVPWTDAGVENDSEDGCGEVFDRARRGADGDADVFGGFFVDSNVLERLVELEANDSSFWLEQRTGRVFSSSETPMRVKSLEVLTS
jgi:hypothetical protein